ncbi:MAG: TetR/AcrR family transcriptional regulator, partial [Rhizonema sp. PD38]|nr:TetR/AcrR family transcriptional regulator [Rhizonema sp. PD38]
VSTHLSMARSATITNDHILEVARVAFLGKGYAASTIEIAQKLGISEASIFKRFATKQKLFLAAMGIPEQPAWIETLESLVGKGDFQQNLMDISLEIVEFHRKMVPRMILLRSTGISPIELFGKPDCPPVRNLTALTTFFDQEVRLGRINSGDSEVTARLLLGALMNYVFLEQMGVEKQMNPQIFVEKLVKTLWDGIAPT